MLFKRCSRCNKRIPAGTQCDCKSQRHKKLKSDVKDVSFYDTDEWKKLRKRAKRHFFGLDFYAFYVYGRIEFGRTAHHIVPIEMDSSRKADFDNLIYLSESSHREIHSLYKRECEKYIKLLFELRERFEREFYPGG